MNFNKSIVSIFVVLLIVLVLNPNLTHKMYKTILGRLFLIFIIIFFAKNNITLGLLTALSIIVSLNKDGYFVEGMDTGTPTTVGEENVTNSGNQIVLTDDSSKKISDLKQLVSDKTAGIDKEDIKMAIMSKDSKQIPINNNMNSSTEVNASSSGMLNQKSAKLEGFLSYSKF